MTEKLYNNDSYSTEFDAVVLNCIDSGEGFWIELDKTLFFPEEGGQTPDKGVINGEEVFDVQLKEGIITHKINRAISVGEKVQGSIDWNHRFSNMQMHSGEHIFSGLVHSLYGFNNVGFHLSNNSATMDYDGKLCSEDIEKLESLANKAIWENHPIRVILPSEDVAESMEYRSKAGIQGGLRIVEIEGVDVCACCAPHVRSTAEVGIFKIVSYENYKGGTRLNYLCGQRAFEDYRRLSKVENELSVLLNSKKEDVLFCVNKLKNKLSETEFSLVAFRRDRISSLVGENNNKFIFLDSDNVDLLRFAMSEMEKKCSDAGVVFAGDDENGYRFICEGNPGKTTEFLKKLKHNFEVKGGGKPGSVQGTVKGEKSLIEKVLFE